MQSKSGIFRPRTFIFVAVLVALVALWYAFRPEKLFINQKVSESAPASIASAQPLFTATIHSTGGDNGTHGRVNVLMQATGRQLQLVGFSTSIPSPLTVSIRSAAHSSPLGMINPGASSGMFAIPDQIDPSTNTRVAFNNAEGQVVATATLEAF